MSMTSVEQFLSDIASKRTRVGVVGLGYVGLPLCIAFASAGVRTLGFDIDPAKIDDINAGRSYIQNVDEQVIADLVSRDLLSATCAPDDLADVDAILACVPTPLSHHLTPDLQYITSTFEAVSRILRRGQLIVLESTTYPGTTADVVKPILERSGLKAGEDFWLAYSPEREDPGNANYSTSQIPKVVGADDDDSRALAVALYDTFAVATVPVASASTAEAVKITENVFRAVNIALVNELKVIFSPMGINVWDVIDAAKTKPFGYMPFYPGPGLGGHCIPIDPFYLTWKAREYGLYTRFIELAGEINSAMPLRVVDELARALDQRFSKGVKGSSILILGMAYKKNVDDIRESPSLKFVDMLEARGAQVAFHDPHVGEIPKTREHPHLAGRRSVAWSLDGLADYDAVLIATDHDDVDYVGLASHAKLVVDSRNACAKAGADLSNVVLA
ncbi:MAG: nucleotide sugar dehydrogenase [Caulobacterales bacterium]|nr:nucleotide sugar dehydrogenase [Caulobacterales bacterium]